MKNEKLYEGYVMVMQTNYITGYGYLRNVVIFHPIEFIETNPTRRKLLNNKS